MSAEHWDLDGLERLEKMDTVAFGNVLQAFGYMSLEEVAEEQYDRIAKAFFVEKKYLDNPTEL